MAKIKYDVSDLDPEDSAKVKEFETPPVGVYPAKIVKCDAEDPTDKDARIHVVLEITKPAKNNYPQLHEYINLVSQAAKFKLDQFLLSVGINSKTKRSGEFDTAKLIGKTIQVRIKHEGYTPPGGETQTRARIGTFLPAASSGIKVPGGAKAATVVAEEETEEDVDLLALGEAADGDDEDAQATLTDLAYKADPSLDPNEYDTWAELSTALSGSSGEEEGVSEGDEEEVDLDALAAAADADEPDEDAQATLADLCAEHDPVIDPDDYDTWAEVVELLADGEGGGEEGEAADYDGMSILELKALCKEREIPTTGKKPELIERLQAFDAEDPFKE